MSSSLFLLSTLAVLTMLVGMSNCQQEGTNLHGPSEAEYANGKTRSETAFQAVTPGLKEAFAQKALAWKSPVFLRAIKNERVLELWVKKGKKFTLFKKYPVLGQSGGLGPKLSQGDRQVPEGFYFFKPGQMNPQSNFHLSFNIGYPNAYDKAHERTGDFIMVHGSNVSIGCLAMGDDAIEEIYTIVHAAFAGGQPFIRVHLFPFRMTDREMARRDWHRWAPFWKNLQEGYRWFEEKKVPPNVTVKDKRYHFD